jgi:uncharacterized protein YndB with AHSA1/START domain
LRYRLKPHRHSHASSEIRKHRGDWKRWKRISNTNLEPSPTTITFALTAENDGTRLNLIHTGIGEGEDWDTYYTALNSGWNVHFKNLTAWLETGICEPPGPTGDLHEGSESGPHASSNGT